MEKQEPNCEVRTKSSIDPLPATIDGTVAVNSFRSQRGLLLNLIRHCLPSLANALLSEFLIPKDVCEDACNSAVNRSERGVALLECLEDRIGAIPTDFKKVVLILESEPFLRSQADDLVKQYCELSSQPLTSAIATSTVISHFSKYLKIVYNRSHISPDSKWPPTPSKEFIHLALIDSLDQYREDYIGHVLKGNIKEVIEGRMQISLETILEPVHGENDLKLVLVEGAPGIGKSTLAWELCRKWEEFSCMKKYCLVILLRLREEEVQKISNVAELFYSYEGEDKGSLIREVLTTNGEGILFILDGFDELPISLQRKSYLLKLIQGSVLPSCSVLVTSRPSATAKLLTHCRPWIEKRIEIIGFTQESIEAYATSIFSEELETLTRFKAYISSSNNPAINSLMYIPLNAAIIVEIFRDCHLESPLPHTLTELYTQLCLTILNRYLQLEHPLVNVLQFKDLPRNLSEHFFKLSSIAFKGMEDNKVVFNSLNPDMVHFGFFDAVSSLYGGGRTSYNFLHLTLQEYFAAYYVSQLSEDQASSLFVKYGSTGEWTIVWRFVAGLTQFKYFNYKQELFGNVNQPQEFEVRLFLIQCLYEAKVQIDFGLICNATSCTTLIDIVEYTPLDMYALGCNICNNSTKVPWNLTFTCLKTKPYEIVLRTLKLDNFLCGLNRRPMMEGVIKELTIRRCEFDMVKFKSFPFHRLGIVALRLVDCKLNDTDFIHLSEVIPHMTFLKTLNVDDNNLPESAGWLNLLYKSFHNAFESMQIDDNGETKFCQPTKVNYEPLPHDSSEHRINHFEQDGLLRVLQQLNIHTNITNLSIVNTGICRLLNSSSYNYYSALQKLIDPISGTLTSFSFGSFQTA